MNFLFQIAILFSLWKKKKKNRNPFFDRPHNFMYLSYEEQDFPVS